MRHGTPAFLWKLARDGDDLRELLGCECWRSAGPLLISEHVAKQLRQVLVVGALMLCRGQPLLILCPARPPTTDPLPVDAQGPRC